jgi:hypothetical protein
MSPVCCASSGVVKNAAMMPTNISTQTDFLSFTNDLLNAD